MYQPLRLVSEVAPPVRAAESFEGFVELNYARLHGALCLLTKDRHEAEDVSQEAFVRVLERSDRVQKMEDPTGYLFRTAMNVFRKRYRRALVALRRVSRLRQRDDWFDQIEARDTIVRAIASLPTDQRAALLVTSFLGYSSEEAGRILGVRPSTVRARATRARSALRAEIGEAR